MKKAINFPLEIGNLKGQQVTLGNANLVKPLKDEAFCEDYMIVQNFPITYSNIPDFLF